MQHLAVDIGYGDTKVKYGDNIFKFASAVEKKLEALSDHDDDSTADVYAFNNKKFTVGDRALTNAVATRGFNFLVKYAPLLVYHAIKLSGVDTTKPIKLITGLSIINWKEKEAFLNAIKTINVNNEIIKLDIKLMAQGQGVFVDAQNDKTGITCVADIGYNTFDFLVFEDGKPRHDLSYANKKGANEIITELQTKLKKRFEFDATEQVAKKVFTDGYILHFGKKIDLTDEIEDAKADYAEFILDELRSQRADLLRSAKSVIFSGGGAYFISQDKMPGNVIFSAKPHEFANVRGYYEA